MSALDLFRQLADPDSPPPEGLERLAAIARAARRARVERDGGPGASLAEELASAEMEEADFLEEPPLAAERASPGRTSGLRLAAASEGQGAARVFRDGDWALHWGQRAGGGSSVLLKGPEPAVLVAEGLRVSLPLRQWVAIDRIEPPCEVDLHLPDGRVIRLRA